MIAFLSLFVILSLRNIHCELLEPECNYAATGTHYYPINACEMEKKIYSNGSIEIFSLKYICNDEDEVEKEEYDTPDCSGEPSETITNLTDIIEHYECSSSSCAWSSGCSYYSCGGTNDTTCSHCENSVETNSLDNIEYHCLPVITDECMGESHDGLLNYYSCDGDDGLLIDNIYYFAANCSGEPFIADKFGGDSSNDSCQTPYYYMNQCYDATTTVYPKSTEIATTDQGLDDMCDNNDEYDWIIRIKFRVLLLVDPDNKENRMKIRRLWKTAFFRAIISEYGWMDDFCFDLKDEELRINEYTNGNSRRLLETEYVIDAGYEYNDNLQDAFFSKDTLFDQEAFGSTINDELIDILIDEEIINSNTTNIEITVELPEEYKEEEKDHRVEGSLINGVVIVGLIDALIFCACLIYIIRNTKPRADQEGDIDWKEARKNHKIPYWVPAVEILDSIIHWILAIMTITIPSYLGWILFCLLLGAEIILYIRYILYKQLILYQIPLLRKEMKMGLNDEIIARRTDVAIFGITLGTIEDLPVIIIAIIVGENFGYGAIEIISLLTAFISLSMKIGLLFLAKFGSTAPEKEENDEKGTEKAIELAEEKENEKQTLTATDDGDKETKVQETDKTDDGQADGQDDGDGDKEKKEEEEEEPLNKENKEKKEEEEEPLNKENKETETGKKDDGDGGDGGGDKPKKEANKDYID